MRCILDAKEDTPDLDMGARSVLDEVSRGYPKVLLEKTRRNGEFLDTGDHSVWITALQLACRGPRLVVRG